MQQYILRRMLIAVPTLFGVTIFIFLAMRILPGDPLSFIYTEAGGVHMLTEEQTAAARRSLGIDRPYHVQYLDWIGDLLRGDMGESFWRGDDVSELIIRRGPISAQIALMAVVVSWIIGVPIGVLSAVERNSWLDYVARAVVSFFLAVPSFWVGMMAVLVGVLAFSWRPPLVIAYPWSDPLTNFQITIGPALAMGLGLAAVVARFTRSSCLEVLNEDFVRTARAKGVLERRVVIRHVLRNALLPVITVSGLALGGLLGGSVAVERAFGVPGLGLAFVFALAERDWTVIQNLTLLYGLIFTVVNLAVDLSYGWLNPTIRYD
jgi:peptide/nickel transport system permease protein